MPREKGIMPRFIDFHTHTLLSDGALLPSELISRAMGMGYGAVAITDHVDSSNMEAVVSSIVRFAASSGHKIRGIKVVPGVEITHVPPDEIAGLVKKARRLGAKIVVCHGETITEPVAKGTNLAAIEARVDILAHPGLVTEKEAALAAKNSVFFEITVRKGHSLTNGHVAAMAKKHKVRLLLNTDTHSPEDLITEATALNVVMGAGLTEKDFKDIKKNAETLLEKTSKT